METDSPGKLRVETISLGDVSLDPSNAREHDGRGLEAIKGSLRRFGQQTPVVIDSGGVVRKGNGTVQAARDLGWETIEAITTDLTDAELTAYAIADNRTSDLSKFNVEVLTVQLESLNEIDIELREVAGFTIDEMRALEPDFEPAGLDEQGQLDEKKRTTCPECGHEFIP